MISFYELKDLVLRAPGVCKTRGEIWHRYLSGIRDGNAFEFGVWNGRSINYMAEVRPDALFTGFDSFEGLPEAWIAGHPAGHFKTDVSKVKWRENVHLEVGWFDITLPAFLARSHAPWRQLQGVHIDCDLGSSTATILSHLGEWIRRDKPMLLFDEFYNYAGYEDHEFKAFLDWVNNTGTPFEVVARNVKHQQVLIQIL
jgi:hypothetical protein